MQALLDRSKSWLVARPHVAILIAIELALFGLAGLPFLLKNRLLQHDLIGHLASAAFTQEFLLPAASGYNPFHYCGAPQNLLYPPLLAYSSAWLGRVVGVGLALKILVVGSVLATPLLTYWCVRVHAFERLAAALATLAVTAVLAFDTRELGGNFISTFEVGNLTNASGLALVLAYAAALGRWRRRRTAFVLPTILLAANLFTHLVGGIVACLFLVAHAACAWNSAPPTRQRRLVSFVLHGLGALALASFFVIPMLAFQRYGSVVNRSYNQYPDSLLYFLASTGVLLGWYVNRRRSAAGLRPIVIACGLLLLFHGFVFNDYLPRGAGLHVHRFKLYDTVLLTIVAVWLFDGWGSAGGRRRRLVWRCSAIALASLGLIIGLLRIDARGPLDQSLPHIPRLNSRVMVLSSPQHQVSDHTLQHLVPMRSGNLVGKGLFIESAANGRFLLDLELLIAEHPLAVRTWGVDLDPLERLESLRPELPRLLELFGFGYVLANEALHSKTGLLPVADLGSGFMLYRAGEAALAEVWQGPIDMVDDPHFDAASEAWFFGNHQRLTVAVSEPDEARRRLADPERDARVLATRVSARQQRIDLDIDARKAVPVLVKFTYAPQWQAFDASGHPLPLYRVTPNFMLVVGRGQVTLRYVHTPLERRAGAISGITALSLLVLVLANRIRRRWPRRTHG